MAIPHLSQVSISTPAGTPPLVVTSSDLVSNLNAQYLNGQLGGYYQNAGNLNVGTLLAARLPAFTGDVSSTVGTVGLTLASVGTAGTYRSVTTDAKGRVTAGTNPTTLAGYGITDLVYGSTGSRNVWTITDWNQGTYPNAHFLSSESSTANAPSSDYTYGLQTSFHRSGAAYRTQMVTELYSSSSIWVRNSRDSDVWTAWSKLLHSNNYSSYALPLSGGTLTGDLTISGASRVFVGSYMNIASSVGIPGMIGLNRNVTTGAIFNASYGAYQIHNNAGLLEIQTYTGAGAYVGAHTFNNSGNVAFITGTVTAGGNQVLHAGNYTSYPPARWATGRTISLTGDVTGTSAAFDGTAALSFAATLANSGATAGTYTKVTVNAKGLITAGTSLTSADLPTYTGTITSGQVTTGLGFTPYNASNPSNYITASASITGYSGGVSSSDTRSVVTTPQTINAGVVFDFKTNTTDSLSDGGSYFGEMTFRPYGSGIDWSGTISHQLGFTDAGNIWQRSGSSTTWAAWKKMLDSSNYSSYALPLSGGTLTGSITATNHIGPGTGLTGTAPGLNIGGNANNITQYTVNQSVGTGNSPSFTGLSVINTITGAVSGSSGSCTGNAATATNGFTYKPGWAASQNLVAATGNLNSSLPSGFYEAYNATNSPTPTTWYNLINVRHSNPGNDHGFQLAMRYYDEVLWSRSYQGGTGANDGNFTTWRAHLHSGNFNSYALPLTGGTLTGVLTLVSSGTAINISGQSDSFGYNATAGQGTYIKGTGATYIYGGGTFFDGTAVRTLLHSASTSAPSLSIGGSAGAVPWSGITSKPTTLSGFGITDAASINGATNQNFSANAIYPYEWIRFMSNSGIYWQSGTYAGWHIYPQALWGMSLQSASTDCGLQLRRNNNVLLGSVYSDGTSIGFLDASNGWGASFTIAGAMNRGSVPGSLVTGNISGSAGSVAWSGITSKPTTLAGFGITDALPLTGGTLTGTLNGTTASFSTKVLSSRFHDSGDAFLFRSGSGTGTTRHLNLADTNSDPSGITAGTGITWGERSDNNPYYLIYPRYYANGSGTYSRLAIAWHTGIEIGAAPQFGGTRFFNNSPFTGAEIFSVGNGDSNVRVVNTLYIGGNTALHAGNFATYALPLNPDGDGVCVAYSDENPTFNGVGVGGGWYFGADGSTTGGGLTAKILNAFGGGVNSTNGYYVGNNNFLSNSSTTTTTLCIDGSNNHFANELTISGTGIGAYNHLKYGGLRTSGDWQTFTNTAGQINIIEVHNITGGGYTNNPTGVYGYGAVMSWRTSSHSFQLYAAHTGDLAYKTQWGNDNYSGWRRILDSTNYPYAAAMNQNVGTGNSPSFTGLSVINTITGAVSGSSGSCTGNAATATSATSATYLNSSNYINRCGSVGNANTDFQNTPAGSVRYIGDDANLTNSPGATWWFYNNYRHSNSSNYWGIQVAWGWEDNANKLATRNVTGGTFGSWVYYLNSVNYTSYAFGIGANNTLSGSNTYTNANFFKSAVGSTVYLGSTNSPPLQVYSNDGGPAFMSFHRGGSYAVNMGLDPDNVLRIGGWSASANRWQLDMSGNQTIAGAMTATNFSGPGTSLTGTASSLVAGSANAIADGVVSTSAKIAASVVTYAKIQNVTAYTVLGNSSASGTQAPVEISMATLAGMVSSQYTTNIGNTYPDRVFMSTDANIKYAPIGTAKAHLGITSKYGNSRPSITGDTSYWTGAMGWGTTDWNSVFDWGSGFTDSWSSPANNPGDTSHHVGVQSVHYTNGSSRYGWQMVNGVATGRWWLRDVWGGGFSSWKEVIHSGNIASQTVAVAGSCTGSAGSVAWTNVSGRPTAVSSFSNDSGYITSGGSISGSSGSCSGNAASVTDGVYLSTNQSIGGVKTFSSAPVATNIAKAWVHYNKSTTTITASYNVSSVTSNGTGVFTVNFTNAMVDTNYVVTGTATYGYDDQDIYGMALIVPRRSTAQQAGSCRLATEFLHAAQVYDCVAVRAVFYR